MTMRRPPGRRERGRQHKHNERLSTRAHHRLRRDRNPGIGLSRFSAAHHGGPDVRVGLHSALRDTDGSRVAQAYRDMALRLTPENLPAAYEYLRACEPFRRWKLPEADDVRFCVTREVWTAGYHRGEQRVFDDHEIGISELCVASTDVLMQRMSHEIIHLFQRRNRLETKNTQHNADFRRRAGAVCRVHVFDPAAFA